MGDQEKIFWQKAQEIKEFYYQKEGKMLSFLMKNNYSDRKIDIQCSN